MFDIETNPDVRAAVAESDTVASAALTFTIKTGVQYVDANDELGRIKSAQKRLETLRTTITKPLNEALRAANDFFRAPAERLATAERSLKSAMIAFQNEQERIQREQQAKVEAAARKERERLEAQARKAEAAGKVEKAQQLEEQAATVVAPIIETEAPKVVGLAQRDVWKFEVTDPAAVPREFLIVDEKKLRAFVTAMKGDAKVAGVRVWSEKTLASRAV